MAFDPWKGSGEALRTGFSIGNTLYERRMAEEARKRQAPLDALKLQTELANLGILSLKMDALQQQQQARRAITGLSTEVPVASAPTAMALPRLSLMDKPPMQAVGIKSQTFEPPRRPATPEEQAAAALQAGQPELANEILEAASTIKALRAQTSPKFTIKEFEEGAFWVPQTPGQPQQIPGVTPKERKGTSVSVINKIGEKGMTKLAEEMSKNLAVEYAKARDVQTSYQGLVSQAQILDESMFTGPLANVKLKIGRALQVAGINFSDDAIANTEAYYAAAAKEVANIIQEFGAGTGLSDADREFAERAAGGDITMTKESLRKILTINKKAKENILKNYNDVASKVMQKEGAESLPFDIRIPFKPTKLPWESQATSQTQTKPSVSDSVNQYLQGRSWER